jgi:hypothetical protein
MTRWIRGRNETPRWTRVPVTIWDRLAGFSLDAKLVYLALLTGEHRTAAPGVFRSGPGALAEAAGFRQKRFLRAIDELREAGLVRVDYAARVWFLPQAVEDDPAANPNVTAAWKKVIAELPECEVTREVEAKLLEFAKESGAEPHSLQREDANGSGNDYVNRSGDGIENQIPIPIPIPNQKQKQPPVFDAPTTNDLIAYESSKGEQVTSEEAEEFLSFHEREGWRNTSGESMTSWKGAWALWRARTRHGKSALNKGNATKVEHWEHVPSGEGKASR